VRPGKVDLSLRDVSVLNPINETYRKQKDSILENEFKQNQPPPGDRLCGSLLRRDRWWFR
jgi:hypothetical protein